MFWRKITFTNQEWDDIIDEEDTDDLTVGYEVVEIWEIN